MSRNGKTLGETWFTGVTLLRKLSKAWRCRLAKHVCETLVQLLLGSIAMVVLTFFFLSLSISEISEAKLPKKFLGCANEPFARGYPAERGSGGALGRRRLTNLARRDPAAPPAPCQYDSFLQGKILNRRDSLPLLRFGLAGADLADHGRI